MNKRDKSRRKRLIISLINDEIEACKDGIKELGQRKFFNARQREILSRTFGENYFNVGPAIEKLTMRIADYSFIKEEIIDKLFDGK